MEPLVHQSLQSRLVEYVVGEFFIGKHGEGGALGSGAKFGGFLDSEIRVLADDRHHHVDDNL